MGASIGLGAINILATHERDDARTALTNEIPLCQEGRMPMVLDKTVRQIRCGNTIVTLTLAGYDWDGTRTAAEAKIAKPALSVSNSEGLIIPAIIMLGIGGVIGNMADIRNETAIETALAPNLIEV